MGYILLGPAGAFACNAGVIFQGRIAFITLRNNFNDFTSLNTLLTTQTAFFQDAVILFSLFAAGFVVGIVQGKIDPASQGETTNDASTHCPDDVDFLVLLKRSYVCRCAQRAHSPNHCP
jgi:hypothetical protein